MKLQKILSRLQKLHPKEIDLSLDRIQNLCKRLGNPQDKLKAISVVGTNGKYSTIQAMFAILKEANFKCNIYTSPHIKSINERFVFNNQELNDEELASLFEEIESANNNEPITFFEILTAAYFLKASQYQDNINLLDKIKNGVPLSVDLIGENGLIGYKARKHSMLIDIDKPNHYKRELFWEKITLEDLLYQSDDYQNKNNHGSLVLSPDAFYILASKEYVSVPSKYAAEMRAYDTKVGEFRAHYAGFFDPGFGLTELGASKTKAVLEVRSHDVPFLIEQDQTVCRLVYEPMANVPSVLYGEAGSSNNYQETRI